MLLRHFPLNAVALAQSNNKNQKKKYQPLLPWWLVPMYVSMYSNGWRRQRSSIETKQTRYGLPWPQSKRCTYARMCVCTESIRYRYTHLKIERLSSRVLDGNKRVDTNMYIHTYICTYVCTHDSLLLHSKFGCYFQNDFVNFVPMASIARKCRRGKFCEWLQEIPFPLLVSIGWNKSMTCHC